MPTDIKASSVDLIIKGKTIIDTVNVPANNEYWNFNFITKNSIPNKPYTMEGIPESVSVAILINSTNLLPFLAYSTK